MLCNNEPKKLKLPWLRLKLHSNKRNRLGVYKQSNEWKKRSENGKKRPGALMVTTPEQSLP
jgi:hypothetical protein